MRESPFVNKSDVLGTQEASIKGWAHSFHFSVIDLDLSLPKCHILRKHSSVAEEDKKCGKFVFFVPLALVGRPHKYTNMYMQNTNVFALLLGQAAVFLS